MDLDRQDTQVDNEATSESGQESLVLTPKGIKLTPSFCPASVPDPFATVEWELRTAKISGDGPEALFEQTDCEVPAPWSALATNVVVSKYFYGEVGTSQRESSVRQLVHRVCRTIADWGREDGYFASEEDTEVFYRDLAWLCVHQHASFNSPVWFNVGLAHQYGVEGAPCNWRFDPAAGKAAQPKNPYEFPQASACFIQSVQDNMEDIMELARSEAMLFKFGSGTGTDMSSLRSQREKLSGGGRPSGPLSFMRVYDQIAAVVKSGGKTRRAAKMQSLKDWHPDIMEFIECKSREEKKVRLLIEEGYDPQEAYDTVPFQNANLSVRLSDAFMESYESGGDWTTRWVTDEEQEGPTYPAREMLQRLAKCTWQCGDPGVQFDTTINRWHTCPESGRINASNPCSEYMFVDDSACNLASINLMRFRRDDGTFDAERFRAACRLVFIAQEILVDHASYPTPRIAENSHRFRPLGLGYSNLGSLIMASGLAYDSDQARGLCGAITAILHGSACLASTELAAAVGTFDEYPKNRDAMLHVMEMHWEQAQKLATAPRHLQDSAKKLWDEVLLSGRRFGFRNAQATVLAPTGTISFMMDCDTTGIEPDIALVKFKQLAGGGTMKIVNQTVPPALRTLGYREEEIASILAHIQETGTVEGAADLDAEHLPIFDCAFACEGGTRSISWRAHIRMMAAAQPFLSGAISKTVNMPKDCAVEDVIEAYVEGWRLGLKALAIYRDGSKQMQPLTTKRKKKASEERTAELPVVTAPRRERLPDTRRSVTHKFNVNGHEGYITVGLYPDNRPGEVFITMAKEGSTIGGLMDCFGTAISMGLQYGVPLKVYVDKFSHTRFEPLGFTKNPEIRMAKSVVDYIFRWLGLTFQTDETTRSPSTIVEMPMGIGSGEGGAGGAGSTGDGDPEPKPVTMRVDGQFDGHGTDEAATEKPATTPSFAVRIDPPMPIASSNLKGAGNGNGNGHHGHNGNGNGNGHAVAGGSGSLHTTRFRIAPATGGSASAVDAVQITLHPTAQPIIRPQEAEASARAQSQADQFAGFQSDAPPCDVCGAITVRCGACYLCHECGNSLGCS